MMLQALLDHALAQRWFPPSYTGPLRTYVKKYAQALGQEAATCPPARYHQPRTTIEATLYDAADPALLPRSVQSCVNVIVKLFQRAVDEGALPSLTPPLPRRGSLHRERQITRWIHPDPETPRPSTARYGLKDWPATLADETARYLDWCTPAFQRGRKGNIRKGEASRYRAKTTIGQVAAYAVIHQGYDTDALTLRQLCTPTLLEDYAWWWIQKRRGFSTKTLERNIGVLKTIARHWLKDDDLAYAIAKTQQRVKEEAPPRVVLDKEGRAIPLAELDRLARACHPFHEERLQASPRARMMKRHVYDGHPLAPSHRGILASTNGSYNASYMATWAELSLIIRLLIHRPLRIGNIANLQFNHLVPQPGGGYDLVIPKADMKNGKFMDRKEWRERFPTRLLPLLQEWLDVWRPLLVNAKPRDPEHPRKPGYLRMETQRTHDAAHYVFLNAWGLRYDTSKLGNSIGLMTARLTQDRPGGPIAWFPHLIRTTWTREMLNAGLNPYVVKRILGDSFKVIDKHYGGYEQEAPSAFAVQLAREIEQRSD